MIPRLVAPLWGPAVTAALVAMPLALRDRLPDPMATHWGPGSAPDGSMPFAVGVAAQVALWGVIWLVLLAAAVRGLRSRAARVLWWGSLTGGGLFVLGLGTTTLLANLDAPTWREARLHGLYVVAVICAAVAVAALGGHLGRGAPDEPSPEGEEP
ncbi:hypothetical protein, partial [Nonomuraea lactucae]|uniref:hypothetical protein n=1 Tax=Nonomuraea lactucae TaxID=2249762 RepID=UPI0019650154